VAYWDSGLDSAGFDLRSKHEFEAIFNRE
jgi:hypothetical protein